MSELFPIAAGVIIGVIVQRLGNVWFRAGVLVLLCFLAGGAATFISGEFEENWAFMLFDVAQVFLVAVVSLIALTWWYARHTTTRIR